MISLVSDLTARLAALGTLGVLSGVVGFTPRGTDHTISDRARRLLPWAGRLGQVWFAASLLNTFANPAYVNGVPIHASRAILGKGKQAPVYIRRQLFGWGMSEAERMLRDLNNYIKTQDVLYEILDESKIDVYHIVGLANKLATTNGASIIKNRVQAANQIKN